MALKDTNTEEEYPYVFMVEESVFQSRITNINQTPIYGVSLAWTYYKTAENGDITFKPAQPESYYDSDFHTSAGTVAVHATSIAAQQESIKSIVESVSNRTLEII
jgi:hypothetical protein